MLCRILYAQLASAVPHRHNDVLQGQSSLFARLYVRQRNTPEGAIMQTAKKYREYAAACRRRPQTMGAEDRAVLLSMAEAWETRAAEAERSAAKNGFGKENRPQGQ